jgi:peptidoglycan/xylan/chitin deacetylase (PgdA/CDA1 family)
MTAGSIYYSGLRALGVTAARRRRQSDGVILCYHNVVPSEADRVGEASLHLARPRFERQMRWLAANYDVLPLGAFVSRLSAGATLAHTAAITFDDGYAGVFEHAVPVLKSLRLPATVFVVAEAPNTRLGFWWDEPAIASTATPERSDRWLRELQGDGALILGQLNGLRAPDPPQTHRACDWQAIRAAIGADIEIGVHSATHRALPQVPDDELEREIVNSRAIVRLATGADPLFFAYPYGLVNAKVRRTVRLAGYRAGFGLGDGFVSASSDRWELPRLNIPATLSDAAFEAWTAGLRARRAS